MAHKDLGEPPEAEAVSMRMAATIGVLAINGRVVAVMGVDLEGQVEVGELLALQEHQEPLVLQERQVHLELLENLGMLVHTEPQEAWAVEQVIVPALVGLRMVPPDMDQRHMDQQDMARLLMALHMVLHMDLQRMALATVLCHTDRQRLTEDRLLSCTLPRLLLH